MYVRGQNRLYLKNNPTDFKLSKERTPSFLFNDNVSELAEDQIDVAATISRTSTTGRIHEFFYSHVTLSKDIHLMDALHLAVGLIQVLEEQFTFIVQNYKT